MSWNITSQYQVEKQEYMAPMATESKGDINRADAVADELFWFFNELELDGLSREASDLTDDMKIVKNHQKLKQFIDLHAEYIQIVPNNNNLQNGLVMVTKKFDLKIKETVQFNSPFKTTGIVSSKVIHMIGIAQVAYDSIARLAN